MSRRDQPVSRRLTTPGPEAPKPVAQITVNELLAQVDKSNPLNSAPSLINLLHEKLRHSPGVELTLTPSQVVSTFDSLKPLITRLQGEKGDSVNLNDVELSDLSIQAGPQNTATLEGLKVKNVGIKITVANRPDNLLALREVQAVGIFGGIANGIIKAQLDKIGGLPALNSKYLDSSVVINQLKNVGIQVDKVSLRVENGALQLKLTK